MLVPIVLLTTALGQTAGPRPGIDVPAGDSRVWQLHQADLSRREAETQAAAATITSARVRARLQLNRVDEALDDLMRLVSERPLDAVDALRNLDAGTHFSDGARDYAPKLNAIFAAAHARAGELPKEDAAVVEFAAKALATLALDDLQQGRAAAARARFRQFLERYPRSEYAWLATLHAAEALANDGDWSAAEREFSEAAATYTGTTIAVVLGRVLAAHAAEAAGHPARGLDRYTAALAAWPRETFAVSLYTRREAPEFRRAARCRCA